MAVRIDDGAEGFMVGAGRHLTTRGVFETYKPDKKKLKEVGKQRKRKLGSEDDCASVLSQAAPAFDIFRGADCAPPITPACTSARCSWVKCRPTT